MQAMNLKGIDESLYIEYRVAIWLTREMKARGIPLTASYDFKRDCISLCKESGILFAQWFREKRALHLGSLIVDLKGHVGELFLILKNKLGLY